MRKKHGFTLIELLAVIVILAIIALIAIPIILNIIDNSNKSANEQSVKLYGNAIEKAVATYMLKDPTNQIPAGDYTQTDGGKKIIEKTGGQELEIKYDGHRVECEIIKIKPNGKAYLEKCKVNGVDVDYIYGSESVSTNDAITNSGACTYSNWTRTSAVCGTETFYVKGISEETVTLIGAENITIPSDLTTEYPVQSTEAGTIAFSDEEYWGEMNCSYSTVDDHYGCWYASVKYNEGYSSENIYDSNSNLYSYLDAYKTYLGIQGVNVSKITIPTYDMVYDRTYDYSEIPIYWAFPAGNYWLNEDQLSCPFGSTCSYSVKCVSGGAITTCGYNSSTGIRPVITIDANDIK